MADRTISVRLQALIGPYSASMAKAAKDTRDFKNEVTGAAAKGSEAQKQLGTGLLVMGGAVGVGFGMATKAVMNFDKAMSEVGAVANATADQMADLRQAAIDAGAATAFSASEAAQAEAELVKAGISVQDVLGGGLTGALSLAAAGTLDLATAAEIAAQSMNIFGLGGADVEHIADVLAAGANKSAADVGQLGDALRQGGLVAAQTGLSFEETAAALAAFADNALVGSDAGTSLKTMLQRLTPMSKEAEELMTELGFSAFDAAGNFIGLDGLANELQTSLRGMTVQQRSAAMSTLFGSDAVRAANILYAEGADGIREYVEAVDDQGAAAEMAAMKLDNLSGDIEALSGSLETALIESGSKANGVLRTLTQTATDVVNGFSSMPGVMQSIALGAVGIGGAVAGVGGVFLHAAPKIDAAKRTLSDLADTSPRLAGALGKIPAAARLAGTALVGLTYITTVLGKTQADAAEDVGRFEKNLPKPETIGDRERRIARLNDQIERTADVADGASVFTRDLQKWGQIVWPWEDNTIKEAEDEVGRLKKLLRDESEALENLSENLATAARETGLTTSQAEDLARTLGVDLSVGGDAARQAIDALVAGYGEMDTGIDKSKRVTMSIEEQEKAAKELEERYKSLGEAFGGFTDSAWATVYEAAEQAARDHAEEMADIENERISERAEAIRSGADDATRTIMDEASAHIEAAGLTGAAATAVRNAAEDKAQAVRDSADAEIEALEEGKASWEDYVGEVKVSTADLMAEWEKQIQAQANWRLNLFRITKRGRNDVAEILAGMGPEGADLAAQFADMTGEEFERAADLFVQAMSDGGQEAGSELDAQLRIAERLGRVAAKDTAEAIAEELGVMVDDVKLIAFAMGISLQSIRDNLVATIGAVRGSQVALQLQNPYARTPGLQVHAASGGYIDPLYRAGGGPSGTDTVPAWLTPGEFVMKKSAVDQFGVPFMQAINRGLSPAFSGAGRAASAAAAGPTVLADITLNYPTPERASDSMVRVGRKLAVALG